jgi:trans-aconitate 2-methyltransferase
MPSVDSWSAKQYVVFEEERTRPVRNLLAALPAIEARTVIDIGCGPGNSTELLAARFPEAKVSGIDSSADMIASARQRLPSVAFETDDIERWCYDDASPFDVILANAVLHWVPDHARLLPALVRRLARGGALAVQMPDNLEQPAHVLMREIAAAGPWAGKLAAVATARAALPEAQSYYERLRSTGCEADVWRTTYFHPLAGGADAIVEWFKGSGLRPFLAPLDAAEQTEFLSRYRDAVARAYPSTAGRVLLPFPRLFCVALR